MLGLRIVVLKLFFFFVGLSTCISICTVAELSLTIGPKDAITPFLDATKTVLTCAMASKSLCIRFLVRAWIPSRMWHGKPRITARIHAGALWSVVFLWASSSCQRQRILLPGSKSDFWLTVTRIRRRRHSRSCHQRCPPPGKIPPESAP